jgi:DNA-binding Lrp family transcriptional regulator
MMAKMDKIDRFILDSLTKDARTSFRKIARDVGVSPDTVIGRYCKLVSAEVIKGSTAIVEPKMLGYEGMVAYHIDMSPSSSYGEQAIKDSNFILYTLIKMPNIILATRTVGDHDLLALGVIFGVNHLMSMCEDISRIPCVKDLQVSVWEATKEILPKYFII